MPDSPDDPRLSPSPAEPPRQRRSGRPEPRFLADVSDPLDVERGCPEAMVPEGHLARTVQELVELLDTRELEAR